MSFKPDIHLCTSHRRPYIPGRGHIKSFKYLRLVFIVKINLKCLTLKWLTANLSAQINGHLVHYKLTDHTKAHVKLAYSITLLNYRLQYPDPVKDSLSADFHQNVHMSFIIVGNMHKKPIKVHQVRSCDPNCQPYCLHTCRLL